jgi:hypothetical protein
LKDHLPNHRDNRRDRDRQDHEHDLNAEPGNGHRPSLRRRLILGIVLGSFLVSCFYWLDLDVPKIDRERQ